jgi:hypothetical protein
LLEIVASLLREEGVESVVRRASYAAIGGGVLVQERLLVFGENSKVVVSRPEGAEYVEKQL